MIILCNKLFSQFGRKVILLCGYMIMTVCLVGASFLILNFKLDTDQFSSDRTIVGYFVVIFLAMFVGVGVLSTA